MINLFSIGDDSPQNQLLLETSLSNRLRPQIKLDDRIVAAGQWKDGQILLNRSDIRFFARQTGDTVQRVLYDTVYHEAFHGFIEPIGRLISPLLGCVDIYQASQDAMEAGVGRGYWYRAEEWGAETYGRLRGYLRCRYSGR